MVKRIVVGAHYGWRDWLAQRMTAVLMAAYTVIAVAALLTGGSANYASWKGLFEHGWMRVATLLLSISLAWHAWIGMRDILMDYVKPTGVRLGLQAAVVLALATYVAWTVQILWR